MELRIAIPTDFSPAAEQAARYTLELFREVPCVFFLMHSYTPSFFRAEYLLHSPGQIGLGDFYRFRVMDKLSTLRKRLQASFENPRHRFITHAAFNTLDAELNEMAEKESLHLIAMGTQGATGAKEVLLGTHAVMVAHKSRIPVLIIPSEAQASEVGNILFPADYTASYATLSWTVPEAVLRQTSARLHVLHTYTAEDDSPERVAGKESLARILEPFKPQWHERDSAGLVEAINAFAAEVPVQFLVLVRNRHTFLENLLVTPVIDQIGFHTRIPMLVLPQVANTNP